MRLKQIIAASVLAAGCTILASAAANADVLWTVNGNFSDGGTVSGTFDINVYGYLEGYNLATTTGIDLPGFDYTPTDSYFSNGTFYVDAQPGYQQDLHLTFVGNLGVGVANNPIVGGDPGPSWECIESYSCYLPAGGPTRYIASGFASDAVPEPSSLLMILAGLGVIAGAFYLARRKATAS